jgi:hypothetical protein
LESVLGEDGWDVVVQRRDGVRFVAADAQAPPSGLEMRKVK